MSDKIDGWNECIDVLFNNGIIDSKDLVRIWQVTTPKQKQYEYFKGTQFEKEYPSE
jgi:hypothetical protein